MKKRVIFGIVLFLFIGFFAFTFANPNEKVSDENKVVDKRDDSVVDNEKNKGTDLKNTDILLYAALYHDCGRSLIISNKKHGIVGEKIAKEKLKRDFNNKDLNSIELLIETHANPDDIVDFKNYKFTDSDKENIQILSNILKDADALDRNRIKVFKFAQCNPNYLRTNEAKEIYHISNIFLKKYEEAKNKTRGIK